MSLDVYLTATRPTEVCALNITHNLGRMAKEAGIYQHLWRPEEIGVTKAAYRFSGRVHSSTWPS